MSTTDIDRLEDLHYQLLHTEGAENLDAVQTAAAQVRLHINALENERVAARDRLGQLHIWVAEARSAKIGFAEYISAQMENAWKIEAR